MRLPPFETTPDETDLFLHSAATWNAHRIHYDRDYAQAHGQEELVVQASLQSAWLVDVVMRWAGAAATVKEVRYRNVRAAHVRRTFTVSGEVADVISVPGTAVVEVTCDVAVGDADGPTAVGSVVFDYEPEHAPTDSRES
jgi:acyl dehydratase